MGERGESESTNAAYSSLLMRIDLISCAQYGRARAKLCKNKRLRAERTETLVVNLKIAFCILSAKRLVLGYRMICAGSPTATVAPGVFFVTIYRASVPPHWFCCPPRVLYFKMLIPSSASSFRLISSPPA